ncbi:S41 family peptidase [Desulfolucanica intricata]|uniref:S41 family peptidase n=1 Tax=Desulfolucanica intricata TaxID=1285191 RepID=UPI000A887C58|nr:S41 family peptidase [Desulfolucanica intricata]
MRRSFGAGLKLNYILIGLAVLLFTGIVFVGGMMAANYKHLGNLVKVISLVRSQYLYPVDSAVLIDGSIKGMVESLGDEYSVYLEPKMYSQLKDQIKGSFGGLGILVGVKEDYLTVVRAYENTPAARAGIRAGDRIVKIDNQDARGIHLESAVELMRGPVGSKVKLTVKRENNPELLTKTLVREEISVPTVEGRVLSGTEIGYIVLSQFTEKTPSEMEKVLAVLQKQRIKGIILDLRDNPGGELISATKVADKFLPSGPIVTVDYRVGKDQTFEADEQRIKLPLVVLVNGGSASAAEILSGAIKDTGVGTLVGEKTFGKGIVQTVFPLENGAGLKLTTARYLTPSKHDIHKKGIQPDVVVSQKTNARSDVQFEKAVEILKQKIS